MNILTDIVEYRWILQVLFHFARKASKGLLLTRLLASTRAAGAAPERKKSFRTTNVTVVGVEMWAYRVTKWSKFRILPINLPQEANPLSEF